MCRSCAQRHLHIADERGATAVEYGLFVALIALVIIGAVTLFGQSVTGLFYIPAGVFDTP